MYLSVRLDKENNRFYIKNNGVYNELHFHKISPNLYQFTYVKIGENDNNEEIENELLHAAFLFAQKEGIQIMSACEKVTRYLNLHKEFTCIKYNDSITV